MLPAKFQLFSKTDAKSNAMTTSRQRNKDTDDFSSSEDEDEDTPECDDDFEVLEIDELSKPAEIRHRTFREFLFSTQGSTRPRPIFYILHSLCTFYNMYGFTCYRELPFLWQSRVVG